MSGPPLISQGLIEKMRKIGNRGLQTSVIMMRRLPVEENPYGDDTESWVTMGETLGWLKMTNTPHIDSLTGAVVGSVGIYRLHLDASINMEVGDFVSIPDPNGSGTFNEYDVQDTNNDDTYRLFTTCTVRRRQ